MTAKNVGCLVVVENGKPMGILTDRDIVIRVVKRECDPVQTATCDVMTKDPITLGEELGLFEALEIVKEHGVRRFPVVDPDGVLTGFFSIDDVLYLLGIELSAVARIIDQESP